MLVESLFADQAAIDRGIRSGYGFPITQLELVELDARARTLKAVEDVLNDYAADHPDSWAGMSRDGATGNVTAFFTGDITVHQAALARLLHIDAPYEVRPAQWTLVQLMDLRARVRNGERWFRTVDADLTGTGIDIDGNRVVIDVSSANQDIVELVNSNFNADGMGTVLVGRFGPGEWNGPRGNLIVTAQDPGGRPIANLDCEIQPDAPAAWTDDIRVTSDDGTCRFSGVGATGIMVILRGRVGSSVLEFGRDRATIQPNATVRLTIEVSRKERPT